MTLRSSLVMPRWGALLPVDALSITAMGCLRLVVIPGRSTSHPFQRRTQALGLVLVARSTTRQAASDRSKVCEA
ncbi:hypothetical protein D3C81_776240 [compost metagenome]